MNVTKQNCKKNCVIQWSKVGLVELYEFPVMYEIQLNWSSSFPIRSHVVLYVRHFGHK